MTEELRAAVAMSYLSGIGPIRGRRLLAHAGGFVESMLLPRGQLAALGVTEEGLAQIRSYDGMPEDVKAGHDGEYAATVSFFRDVRIVLSTLGYLAKPPPTY